MEQLAPPTLVVGWSPDGALRILDQRRLPAEVVHRDLRTLDEVVEAIRTLAVRGAPAIGVAAAIGLAVMSEGRALREVERATAALRAARPTAVNLPAALDRMLVADAALQVDVDFRLGKIVIARIEIFHLGLPFGGCRQFYLIYFDGRHPRVVRNEFTASNF